MARFSSCVVMGWDLFRFSLRGEAEWIIVMVSRCSLLVYCVHAGRDKSV